MHYRRGIIKAAVQPRTTLVSRDVWLQSIVAGKRALDVGCVDHLDPERTSAPLHRALVEVGGHVVGVDVSAEGVQKLQGEGFDVRFADVTEPGLDAKVGTGFDVVIAGEILEHLLDLTQFLHNVQSVLADGGVFIVSTPNPHALSLIARNMVGRVADNADHVAYYWPSGMVELATRSGFTVERIYGERYVGRGADRLLFPVARLLALLLPTSFADCCSLVYVLRPAVRGDEQVTLASLRRDARQ